MKLTPHASAAHWSGPFIGVPHVPGAEGPEAFDCWGLVRHVSQAVFGKALPALSIAQPDPTPEQWRALRTLVKSSAWKSTRGPGRAGDVLLMIGADGLPHVGILIDGDRVLHTITGGAAGIDRIEALGGLGFGHLEFWRHA
jgi:cell wall-associated NlpC family hydrolase